MSSIMRWRNGLMGLSVMAITPVSHEVSEPHDLETRRAILLIPTSNPPRARSRWGVYRESGLVHGGIAAIRAPLGEKVKSEPLLPFLVGPCTGGLRQLRASVGAMAIYRNRLQKGNPPTTSKNFWLWRGRP